MFSTEVVDAIVSHMNVDHLHDNLTICRGTGRGDAVVARMVAFDTEGADFEVETPTGAGRHRVAWTRTISERSEVREELVSLVERYSAEN